MVTKQEIEERFYQFVLPPRKINSVYQLYDQIYDYSNHTWYVPLLLNRGFCQKIYGVWKNYQGSFVEWIQQGNEKLIELVFQHQPKEKIKYEIEFELTDFEEFVDSYPNFKYNYSSFEEYTQAEIKSLIASTSDLKGFRLTAKKV